MTDAAAGDEGVAGDARAPVSTVVFDFGGVLFRWQPTWLLRQTVPDLAADDTAAAALARGIFQGFAADGDWSLYDLGRIDEDALAARIAARLGCRAAAIRRVVDAIPAHLAPLPASVALVRRLQQAGLRLLYLSNMPLAYAAHLESSHDVVAAFEGGIFSSRVGLIKPDAAIFRLTEDRFGLVPGRTLFVDDNPHNVRAARQRGWQAMHFDDPARVAVRLGLAS